MNGAKDRIIDAAERVVLRDGGAHLTLDAVAAEASVSKGGLLYHFPTKEDLIRGMILRLVQQFVAKTQQLMADDPCPTGRWTRAYVRATMLHEDSPNCCHMEQVSAALLAAVANNPALLGPMYEHGAQAHQQLLKDGIDPVLATIARLAADGLWILGLFSAPPLDPDLHARVLAKLEEFTRPV